MANKMSIYELRKQFERSIKLRGLNYSFEKDDRGVYLSNVLFEEWSSYSLRALNNNLIKDGE